MMETLLHTHPCYPIDASVSRGYAGIFFAHTCSTPARTPVQKHRAYLESNSSRNPTALTTVRPFNLPERRTPQFW
jgi:hypothetical protein